MPVQMRQADASVFTICEVEATQMCLLEWLRTYQAI